LCHHDTTPPKIPISLHHHGAESTRERLGEKCGLNRIWACIVVLLGASALAALGAQ
jgi:hypothetical protein